MKRTRYGSPFGRNERKILFVVMAAIFGAAVSTFGICYRYLADDLALSMLRRSEAIFSRLAHQLPPRSFSDLKAPSDVHGTLYGQAHAMLDSARQMTAVRYLYTARRGAGGVVEYVVDGLPPESSDFRTVGHPLEEEVLPMVDNCLAGVPTAATRVLHTSWGEIIPACIPIEEDGNVVGALVAEFDVKSFMGSTRRSFRLSVGAAGVMALGLTLMTGWLLRRLSIPLYRRLAYTDLLTGAHNRNAFELDIARLRKDGNLEGLVVVVCDLNLLKAINDEHGHAMGDAYIKGMSDFLHARFKGRGQVYRIGGDEFCVLLRRVTRDAIEAEMRRIYSEARGTSIDGCRLFFAYGMARYSAETDADLYATLIRADARMYAHKRETKRAMGLPVTTVEV